MVRQAPFLPRLGQHLANFNSNRRRHGLRAALRVAWKHRFHPERVTLRLFGLDRPSPLPPLVQLGVETRFASAAEVADMVACGLQEPDTPAHLAAGDACLLQFVAGTLAGWAWLSTQSEVSLLPGLYLRLPPDAGYVYRTWTAPELRGHGLQPRRTLALTGECQRRGRRRLLCFVESTNLASLKGVAKAGYTQIATLQWTPSAGRSRARLRVDSPDWHALSVRVDVRTMS